MIASNVVEETLDLFFDQSREFFFFFSFPSFLYSTEIFAELYSLTPVTREQEMHVVLSMLPCLQRIAVGFPRTRYNKKEAGHLWDGAVMRGICEFI